MFSETAGLFNGYYVFAAAAPGELAVRRQDVGSACRYYALALAHADRRAPEYQRARAYLR